MTVYVVIGVEGEYSDRQEYVAGVFTDRENALRLVEDKTARSRENAKQRYEWGRKRDRLIKEAEEKNITPQMRSYYGYPPKIVTAEDYDKINKALGKCPEDIYHTYYYVVSVPMNIWGRWDEFDESVPDLLSQS